MVNFIVQFKRSNKNVIGKNGKAFMEQHLKKLKSCRAAVYASYSASSVFHSAACQDPTEGSIITC